MIREPPGCQSSASCPSEEYIASPQSQPTSEKKPALALSVEYIFIYLFRPHPHLRTSICHCRPARLRRRSLSAGASLSTPRVTRLRVIGFPAHLDSRHACRFEHGGRFPSGVIYLCVSVFAAANRRRVTDCFLRCHRGPAT